MLNLRNNDGHIVDRDNLIVELSKRMLSREPISITLNGEGPCSESLGLYALLDRLTNEFEYNKNDITITTCNLIEHHNNYNINITPQMMYLNSARDFCNSTVLKDKQFDAQFKHFGNFIGHGNLYRLFVAGQLYSKYKNQTLQSYHFMRHSDYHRMFIGIEDLIHGNYTQEEVDCAYELLNTSPLLLDQIDEYPIVNPATFGITKIYHKFFVEIVNLTYFSGNTFYIDEKIWRPIIMHTPFMVQGPQNYIINLRNLGFRTFNQYWDEGYSEDPPDCQVRPIMCNVEQLSTVDITGIQSMYNDMKPILEHNYQRLLELVQKDFSNVRK